MQLDRVSIAFIGAGNMAEAIARSLLRAGVSASSLSACDVAAPRRELFASLGIKAVESIDALDATADVVLLAVKPQQMPTALASAERFINATFISIAAGIKTTTIEQHVGDRPVVRVMPNTPLMVGLGASAIAPGTHATGQSLDLAEAIFAGSGIVVRVREDQLDAVTALSGSGPAYVFFLVEQMVAAGVKMGLDPRVAHDLATQTALGAGQMLRSDVAPAELRRRVTSPGGTTQAAIEHLQSKGFEQTVIDALLVAERRGKELGAK
ncbi:MAG: pyrroline-5-carboxylate reductase [Tepidisphaeraceae bacterium]